FRDAWWLADSTRDRWSTPSEAGLEVARLLLLSLYRPPRFRERLPEKNSTKAQGAGRKLSFGRFLLSQLVQILLKAMPPPLKRRAFHLPKNSTASSSLATGDSLLRFHTSLGRPRACQHHDKGTSAPPLEAAPIRRSI